jgi:hypothetical protein
MRGLLILTLLGLSTPALAETKHYLVIRGVDEAPGVKSNITAELRTLFEAELKKRPEFVVVTNAAEVPPQSAKKTPPVEVSLRVLAAGGEVKPPAPGKQFRVLERHIQLSVFGNTLPDKKLAIGGDGDATLQAEIGKQDDVDKEGKALMLDCAKEAIVQAVNMTATKLKVQGKTVKVKKK